MEFSQLDMPALSSTMKEGKVVSWLKGEGDSVEAGEAIMVVESDKADMDVEAFEDGFVAAIITEEGEAANVGSPVALIAANEADIPALKAYAENMGGGGGSVAAPPAASAAAPAKVSLFNLMLCVIWMYCIHYVLVYIFYSYILTLNSDYLFITKRLLPRLL